MYVLVNNMRFVHVLYMLAIDSVGLTLIAWWIDKWNPLRTIGTKQRPWFCVLPQYWCPRSAAATKCRVWCDKCEACDWKDEEGHDGVILGETAVDTTASNEGDDDADTDATKDREQQNHFEAFTVDQKYRLENNDCIKVRGLVKRFRTPDGIKTAVDELDMTLFDGEIFVLLGHNGAGKTTTISMLSGLLRPSAGKASILGMNVWTQMGSIRRQMGVCPQGNVLFEDLTAEEHLWMFGRLKGVGWKALREQVKMRLRDVGMRSKARNFAGQLSGGQKRKLCLAIALMGDSKVLFLDEPTSGMDVFAQRSVWALLRKIKRERIIVLTTHSMEEADMLGDRIGIMAEGRMVCCGTPLFLKSLYGVGYSLVVTTIASKKGHSFVQDIVKKHVPEATQHEGAEGKMSKEISFQLPFEAAQRFEAMFTEFDAIIKNEEENRIDSYGISVTTMEEVFLKSAHDAKSAFANPSSSSAAKAVADDDTTAVSATTDDDVVSFPTAAGKDEEPAKEDGEEEGERSAAGRPDPAADGGKAAMEAKLKHIKELQKYSCFRQLYALLARRIAYALRDLKLALFQFGIPIAVLCFGLMLLILVGIALEQPSRNLLLEAQNFNNVLGVETAEHGTALPYLPDPYAIATVNNMVQSCVSPAAVPNEPLAIQTAEKSEFWDCDEFLPAGLVMAKRYAPEYALQYEKLCHLGKYLLQTHDKKPDGGAKGGTTYLAVVQNETTATYQILANYCKCEPNICMHRAELLLTFLSPSLSLSLFLSLIPIDDTHSELQLLRPNRNHVGQRRDFA